MDTTEIKTYSGLRFDFRPANTEDEAAVFEFWQHVSGKSNGARSLGIADPTRFDLVRSDKRENGLTSTFLALGADGHVISIAVLVVDDDHSAARVMVFTRDEITFHGISWALLARVLTEAEAKGVATVSSILSSEDVAAIKLEVRMGFVETDYPDDASLRKLVWTFPRRVFPEPETAPGDRPFRSRCRS